MMSAQVAQASINLARRSFEAEELWLRGYPPQAERWLVNSVLLGEPVIEHDGKRYYGDDVRSLVLLPQSELPVGGSLIHLRSPAVIGVELYAGELDAGWVDKGILLRFADEGALLLSAECSGVSVRYDAAQIQQALADWANDWPDLTLVQSVS